jgi:transcriptional regulator GlxA family with amidase domain
LFVTHVGLGLPRYLNDLRLATAKLLLETTPWRLRVIAAEVGFPNERVFRMRFKDKYGELPSEYRNSIAE